MHADMAGTCLCAACEAYEHINDTQWHMICSHSLPIDLLTYDLMT